MAFQERAEATGLDMSRGSSLNAIVACILVVPALAQSAGRAPVPAAQKRLDLTPLELVASLELPPLDLEALRKEDAQREREGLPARFALPFERRISPAEAGTWEDLEPERLLWRLRIRSPGAASLNLGFGRFRLPEGAALHLYSADRGHAVRPFTAEDNEAHGELWTPVVLTDDLVLELVLPARELEHLELELDRVNQGYRGFGAQTSALISGSCNLDVVCPDGIPWRLEIPSVGLVTIGGIELCSGFLVNNLRQDLAPFFMTAKHCGLGPGNDASLVVYWNYQNSTCRPPFSGQSGLPGDGSLGQFSTGSHFRAAHADSDFTLVELDDDPDPAFELSWAGWDATGSGVSQAVTIHHPGAAEKRISFEYQPPTVSSYFADAEPGDGTHLRVADWDVGTTEVGSSGSPLFDAAQRVIGQLHGGLASCSSDSPDWYGRFARSWTGGGTNSTRLRNWLDPDGLGALVLDTVSMETLCSPQGELELDRAGYGCSDALVAQVLDCGLNLSSTSVESVSIQVWSDSEPAGEALLLTETGPATSRFRGTLPIAPSDAAGVLRALEGELVTARYVDADDGQGGQGVEVRDTATIDCTAPSILAVSFADVGPTSARMTILADEAVLARADFGLTCGSPLESVIGETYATSASVLLAGLQPGTTYQVHALAVDEAGNLGQDESGGPCHAFQTADALARFTEEFLGDNDLAHLVLNLQPDPGPEGYVLCQRPTLELPTDPVGGTLLNLADDDSRLLTLSAGHAVQLYGQSYTQLWVNANGNLTFGAADEDFTESLADHFSVRRVAGLWDDLRPAAGGSVSWKELDDRVSVTWLDVPEFNSSNRNTFQIDLFYGGRIRLAYLGIDAADGIAGISAGTGLDPYFVESDLSAGPPCTGPGPSARAGPAPAGSVGASVSGS
jgi:hypothetical protein